MQEAILQYVWHEVDRSEECKYNISYIHYTYHRYLSYLHHIPDQHRYHHRYQWGSTRLLFYLFPTVDIAYQVQLLSQGEESDGVEAGFICC